MSKTTFADLNRAQRRRLALRSAARMLTSTFVLLVIYAFIPVAAGFHGSALIELIIGLAFFAGILAWQLRSILDAEHPELRAAEALAAALPALIMVFAFTYLSLDHANHSSFTQPLNRVGAFYFTVTVLSTVGFGDISAKSDPARILVTIQILLDLVFLVAIARTIVFAARVGVRRQHERSADHELTQ
jgi:voltage-gated potassium channel